MRFTEELRDIPYVADLQQLTTYEEIVEVLRSRDFVQGAFDLSAPHFLENSLLILDGPEHFERRRVEAHLFSKQALSDYKKHELEPMIDLSLNELREGSTAGEPVRADLVPLTRQILCRVAAMITGLDDISLGSRTQQLMDFIDRFGQGMTVEWATGDKQSIIDAGLAARDEFERTMFAPSAARRRALVAEFQAGRIPREELPRDLITLLYLHWKDEWDDDLPLRETTAFLVGSMQTTSQAFPHFIMQMEDWFARHPEHRRLVDDDPDFLRRALFESLRLFVASPVRIRRATKDIVLSSGRKIMAGERVGLLYRAANLDPRLFGEDAAAFNPLRPKAKPTPWGLAFGGGAHACLGRPLVTGIGSGDDVSDGTMVIIARKLLAAGLQLDPDQPPVPDPDTYYDAFKSVPILFSRLV